MPETGLKYLLITASLLVLNACSSATGNAPALDESGRHPVAWYVGHRSSYRAEPARCTPCHGSDLAGGTANIGCFRTSLNGLSCHGHPAGWAADPSQPQPHGQSAKQAPGIGSGFSSCQGCHGDDFNGGLLSRGRSCFSCHKTGTPVPHSPRPWRGDVRTHGTTDPGNAPVCAICHLGGRNFTGALPPAVPVGTPPGCFNNSLCHAATHPVPWLDHKDTPRDRINGFCTLCHGDTLAGGKGPACSVCHRVGSPLATGPCSSCHDAPPAGSVYPNRAGAHARHTTLALGAGTCQTCHAGGGSGTLGHYNRSRTGTAPAVVVVRSLYNAVAGIAVYDYGTGRCTNVKCHGGLPAPVWLNGTLNVNTQCLFCHTSGTTQYNGYYSGRHTAHVNPDDGGASCSYCHNTGLLVAVHFANLSTSFMEGPASATIDSSLLYDATVIPRTCTPACHFNKVKSW